jgi:hypothetical protein
MASSLPWPSPERCRLGQAFKGKINWIQLDQRPDDHDHLISSEERLKLAMTRQ